ncbi:MAG: M23 family metallopeptidase [Acidobacteriota bacterium]
MIYKKAALFVTTFGLLILLSNISYARHFSVNLKTANGNFVTAENGGGGIVNGNRPSAREWETFTLLDLNEGELESGDPVALKTVNGNFFSAINGGGDKLLADKTALVTWETFKIERMTRRPSDNLIKDGDRVSFRTMKNNFISALDGGGREVNAKPTAVSNSEMFIIRMTQPTAGKLSGPFTAPQMIIRPVVGVDDLARTSGDIKLCKNNYFGENFPNCYRGHEGTDFGLIGHVLTQLVGSIDVYSVAGGKVVAKADGNTDLCFYKIPPPPANSPAQDFVFCINDKNNAKEANFVAILQDDGVIAYYYHLKRDSISVNIGDRVDCGQFLGKVGSSGISSAPHLHLTLQKMKRDSDFPKTPSDFKSAGGNRDVADIINPYSLMLWMELSNQVPKKICGENRAAGEENQPCSNLTQCKFGLTCKDGKCQKISVPPPPARCGNNPPCPPGFACDNGRCVLRRP